jgi:hypothetical protein
MSPRKKRWSWRVADRSLNEDLNLLYEPGNWGDILKGTWAALTVPAVARSAAGQAFRFLDPFAGAPTYPLVDGSRRRLESIAGHPFVGAEEPFAARGLLASTSLLVREAAGREGARADLLVFDLDAARREAWRAIAGATVLDIASGDDAVASLAADPSPPELILVDPYDLFHHWQRLLPGALAAARRSLVLLYAYNKAPRSPGDQRAYAALRRALAERAEAGTAILAGRLPADPGVARAYHEVYLAGPAGVVGGLRAGLADATRALACRLAEAGSFEEIAGGG